MWKLQGKQKKKSEGKEDEERNPLMVQSSIQQKLNSLPDKSFLVKWHVVVDGGLHSRLLLNHRQVDVFDGNTKISRISNLFNSMFT